MPTQVEIRRLSTFTFEEALKLWNEGFAGYYVDLTLSIDRFMARIHGDHVSPEHSLVAVVDSRPCGFLLNAIRRNGVTKAAWNGGTGVAPEFRGQGIGKALLRAALEVYREQGVVSASLEAVVSNDAAIKLYKQFGYEHLEQLVILRRPGPITVERASSEFLLQHVAPPRVSELPFYTWNASWQNQWQSVTAKSGDAVIVTDSAKRVLGYALYIQSFDEQAKLKSVTLAQCEVSPDVSDGEPVLRALLDHVFSPFDVDVTRVVFNFRADHPVRKIVEAWGFEVFFEQVHLVKACQ